MWLGSGTQIRCGKKINTVLENETNKMWVIDVHTHLTPDLHLELKRIFLFHFIEILKLTIITMLYYMTVYSYQCSLVLPLMPT